MKTDLTEYPNFDRIRTIVLVLGTIATGLLLTDSLVFYELCSITGPNSHLVWGGESIHNGIFGHTGCMVVYFVPILLSLTVWTFYVAIITFLFIMLFFVFWFFLSPGEAGSLYCFVGFLAFIQHLVGSYCLEKSDTVVELSETLNNEIVLEVPHSSN